MGICCENDIFYKYYRIESRLILTFYAPADKLPAKQVQGFAEVGRIKTNIQIWE